MRIKAVFSRVLKQIIHDKRTVALILIAPIIILSLVYIVFEHEDNSYDIGIINAPSQFVDELKSNEDYSINIVNVKSNSSDKDIKDEKIIASIDMSDDYSSIKVFIDGSKASDSTKVLSIIKSTVSKSQQDLLKSKNIKITEPDIKTSYVYGSSDSSAFDNFAAPLLGIIIFLFVFLISGINFLTERNSGTLEKLLSTPIRRYELIIGYVLGFSVLAILQTTILTFFVIYVLNLTVAGSVLYILLINLLTAISALTLGILFSTLANSEFQMMQFIPIVIVPQIFLCGLFSLSKSLKVIGYFMPLTYTTNALTEVIIKGNGFSAIWLDCLILLLSSIVFIIINVQLLKKYRKL